jgi:hypothetical protein
MRPCVPAVTSSGEGKCLWWATLKKISEAAKTGKHARETNRSETPLIASEGEN